MVSDFFTLSLFIGILKCAWPKMLPLPETCVCVFESDTIKCYGDTCNIQWL